MGVAHICQDFVIDWVQEMNVVRIKNDPSVSLWITGYRNEVLSTEWVLNRSQFVGIKKWKAVVHVISSMKAKLASDYGTLGMAGYSFCIIVKLHYISLFIAFSSFFLPFLTEEIKCH